MKTEPLSEPPFSSKTVPPEQLLTQKEDLPDRCQKRLDTRILFRRFKNPGNNLERGKYTKRQNGQRHPGFG